MNFEIRWLWKHGGMLVWRKGQDPSAWDTETVQIDSSGTLWYRPAGTTFLHKAKYSNPFDALHIAFQMLDS